MSLSRRTKTVVIIDVAWGAAMTEAEWFGCDDMAEMLRFVIANASERKVRLYLCGGCRHITHLFYHQSSINAVEVAERFADGLADEGELYLSAFSAECPTFGFDFEPEYQEIQSHEEVVKLVEMGALSQSVLYGGEWQINEKIRKQLQAAADVAYHAVGSGFSDMVACYQAQIDDWPGRWLFDCVFGNPFLPTLEPQWLALNDCIVPNLARLIYDDRAFEQLPILADALEDAGCSQVDLLGHLRGAGPHTRGCWPVDLILGKS